MQSGMTKELWRDECGTNCKYNFSEYTTACQNRGGDGDEVEAGGIHATPGPVAPQLAEACVHLPLNRECGRGLISIYLRACIFDCVTPCSIVTDHVCKVCVCHNK